MSSISEEEIISRQELCSHERLLSLVAYDPITGFFYSKIHRPGHDIKRKLGHVEKNGYRRIRIDRRRYLAHRLAWLYVNGTWPDSDIDHRNLRRDDNWISNLRPASQSQNLANTKARSSKSGMKGAHWNASRGYWQSYIKISGRSRFLGRFDNPLSAHKAYVAALSSIHGEFARAA